MHISYTTSLIGSHQIIRTGIFPFVGLMLRAVASGSLFSHESDRKNKWEKEG